MNNDVCHSRNAYIVITDLHMTYVKKDNRYNYQQELNHVFNQINDCIDKYASRGYNVVLLLLGDVFDKGYLSTFDAISANNSFICLRNKCSAIYSVIGNHELSYYSNNPFFTLTTEINSEKLQKVRNKVFTPQGLINVVNVVDCIEDGEVCFHFNHYGTEISKPVEGKINVGLFHLDIVCNEILQEAQRRLQENKIWGSHPVNFENNNPFKGYDYCFLGHLHKVYGLWKWIDEETNKDTFLYYLASLGRPNYTEVNNNFLERNLPAILVEDGKLLEVEDNLFDLLSVEQSVKMDVVATLQEKNEQRKRRKIFREYVPIADDPVTNILAKCSTDSQRHLCKELLQGDITKLEVQISDLIHDYVKHD